MAEASDQAVKYLKKPHDGLDRLNYFYTVFPWEVSDEIGNHGVLVHSCVFSSEKSGALRLGMPVQPVDIGKER